MLVSHVLASAPAKREHQPPATRSVQHDKGVERVLAAAERVEEAEVEEDGWGAGADGDCQRWGG